MTVEFELDGQRFIALNGGPQFKFSEALSFQINCDPGAGEGRRRLVVSPGNACAPRRVGRGMARTPRVVRVVVRWRAGPTWTSGAVDEQPGWDEHAAFIDDLVERGIFVMGGPLADQSGSLSLLENVTEQEARELVAADPFVANGVFELEEVRAWNVFVDEVSSEPAA